jgi:predicted NodU family carbamoyl transferase
VIFVGTARARLGPAAAVVDTTRQRIGACEENRLTRALEAEASGPPKLAVAELLRFLGSDAADVIRTASVDEHVEARRAHAEYAFRASTFDRAVVLVCDAGEPRGWSAWEFDRRAGTEATAVELEGEGMDYPIAATYSRFVAAMGFRAMRDEHLVESLARSGHVDAVKTQRRLGDDLLELIGGIKAVTTSPAICLSGGLFFNTFYTSLAASAGIFDRVYAPAHPGRNGAALGAALLLAGSAYDHVGEIGSPYLGPSYTDAEIKQTIENCKLSFDLLHDDRLFEVVLHALSRGRLIGWYHGRLEWGPRALGHRSVLADPFAPHVLENLNAFLKRRPAYRTYGVSVPLADLDRYFERTPASPDRSSFMQFEYRPRDVEKFRSVLPDDVQSLRVHTVDDSEPRFLRLLQMWGEKTGAPVLVNTSFNGFHEPLVCSPRDAIRVFYGTGLDILALENFYLRK